MASGAQAKIAIATAVVVVVAAAGLAWYAFKRSDGVDGATRADGFDDPQTTAGAALDPTDAPAPATEPPAAAPTAITEEFSCRLKEGPLGYLCVCAAESATPERCETVAGLDRCRPQIMAILEQTRAATVPGGEGAGPAAMNLLELAEAHFAFGALATAATLLKRATDLAEGAGVAAANNPQSLELEARIRTQQMALAACGPGTPVATCTFEPDGRKTPVAATVPYGHRVEELIAALDTAGKPGVANRQWLRALSLVWRGADPFTAPGGQPLDRARFANEAVAPRFQPDHPFGRRAGTRAGGVAIADFDGDGHLDVALSSMAPCDPVRLYHGDGRGGLAPAPADSGLAKARGVAGLVPADVDNDGDPDLYAFRGPFERGDQEYATGAPVYNALLINNGQGRFRDRTAEWGLKTTPNETRTATWADYDLDGWLDLMVCNSNRRPELFRNIYGEGFREVAAAVGIDQDNGCDGAAWGDVDNDGDLDLVLATPAGNNVLYINEGNGLFSEQVGFRGRGRPWQAGPTWFRDLDNDGWLDLVMTSPGGSPGRLILPAVEEVTRGSTTILFRNDQGLLREAGGQSIALVGQPNVLAGASGDVDNDGDLDLFLGTGQPAPFGWLPNVLLINGGDGRFANGTAASGLGHLHKTFAAAFADLDGDGGLDLVANLGGWLAADPGEDVLYRHPGPEANWIRLHLVGTVSNRDAIGARIAVDLPGGRRLRRHVPPPTDAGSALAGLHIGLGAADRVERLRVEWPASGTTTTAEGLAANRAWRIVEGQPTAQPWPSTGP